MGRPGNYLYNIHIWLKDFNGSKLQTCQQVNLPEVMIHIKYQLIENKIEQPRAAQNIGHIGTSISYFLDRNHKGPYKLYAYDEYNYGIDKDNRKTVAGYALLNNAVYIPTPLYSNQTVFALIKELKCLLFKDK